MNDPDLTEPMPDGDAVDATAGAAGHIQLAGQSFIADPSGALYWPRQGTLIVADLHLEKGSAFAATGRMLPPYDTRETLARLSRVVARYQAGSVVALGDSFQDADAERRLSLADLGSLRDLQTGRDWVWITGNHDPVIGPKLGGRRASRLDVSGLALTHTPEAGQEPQLSGHLHPVAKLVRHTRSIRRPCFIGDGQRLIMPAFGAFTGGLNVLDDAFMPLFPRKTTRVWMLGADNVYPLGLHQLVAD